jgi:hypothetical protein
MGYITPRQTVRNRRASSGKLRKVNQRSHRYDVLTKSRKIPIHDSVLLLTSWATGAIYGFVMKSYTSPDPSVNGSMNHAVKKNSNSYLKSEEECETAKGQSGDDWAPNNNSRTGYIYRNLFIPSANLTNVHPLAEDS